MNAIPIYLTEQELWARLARMPAGRRLAAKQMLARFWIWCAEQVTPEPKLIVCRECGRAKKGHEFVRCPTEFNAGEPLHLCGVICPECRGVTV